MNPVLLDVETVSGIDLNQIVNDLLKFAVDFGLKLLGALVILIVGRMVIKWILKLVRNSKAVKKVDTTVARFLLNILSFMLHVILVISIVAILGVPVTSVIALLASAGVAIGLALQGSLSNLAGGVMILIFRPFRMNDYVELDGLSGTVTDVGIFYTTLCTPDNRVVIIPNGGIMAKNIINYSVKDTRRVDLVFSVAYGTDVKRVCDILKEEAAKHELTLKDPAPFARLTKHNDSALNFTLRVWVRRADYWTVNFDLLEAINNRFAAENIVIPFNQLDVHIAK